MNNFIYQTKCRRCDKIHDWWFSNDTQFTQQGFIQFIVEKLSIPSTYRCDKCNMNNTVQDLVSYEIKPEEEQK